MKTSNVTAADRERGRQHPPRGGGSRSGGRPSAAAAHDGAPHRLVVPLILLSLILLAALGTRPALAGAHGGEAARPAGAEAPQTVAQAASAPSAGPGDASPEETPRASGDRASPAQADPEAATEAGGEAAAESGTEGSSKPQQREPRKSNLFTKKLDLPAGQTLSGDRYVFAESVDIVGTLEGDLFAFASATNVPGRATESVNAFSGKVTIGGTVEDDVRAFAGEVAVSGSVGGDFLALAGKVDVSPGAEIKGETVACGGRIVLSGTFRRPIRSVGGQIVFGGQADDDVWVEADVVKIEEGARIKGNLKYSARQELEILRAGDPRGRDIVEGSVTFIPKEPKKKSKAGPGFLWQIWTFISALIVGCVLIALVRRPVQRIITAGHQETLKSLGFGILGHVFVPFAAIILILLCLTLPFGVLLLVAWGVLFYLAKLAVSASLADAILRRMGRSPSPYLALFLGMIALWILFRIPVLGALLYWFVVPVFGIGAIWIGLRSSPEAMASIPAAGAPQPPQAPPAAQPPVIPV